MEIGEKYFLAQETSLDLTKNKVNVITGYLGSASITDIITGESVADTIDFGLQETVEEILSKLNTIPKISDFSGQSVSPTSSSLETTTNNYNVKVNEGFYNTESTISIPNATFVNDLGIRSEVIAEGNSIAGVEGSFMGSTGNATAAQVLDGYTFSNSEAKGIEGTMPDFSTNNATTTAKNSTFSSGVTGAVYAKPTEEGYYTSDTQIKVPITNLKPANIKKGVNIGGVTGTYDPSSGLTATASDVTKGKTAFIGGKVTTGTSTAKKWTTASVSNVTDDHNGAWANYEGGKLYSFNADTGEMVIQVYFDGGYHGDSGYGYYKIQLRE